MSNNHLAAPGPELAVLYTHLPPPANTYTADGMKAARDRWFNLFMPIKHGLERPFLPPESAYHTQDYTVLSDGANIKVRRYTPAGEEEKTYPLLYWIHGGGFIFPGLDLDDLFLRPLCVDSGITIIAVDYRVAPEDPFPTGLNDSYNGMKWAVANASELKADVQKGFIVGGQSSGGNFAVVMAQRASHDPFFAEARPTGQILQIPVLLHPDAVPEKYKKELTSYVQNEHTPMLGATHMRDYYEKYGGRVDDPEVSPFLYEALKDLPPTYIQVCGLDPLRDEGLVYAQRLEECGVPTKVDTYQGAAHGFHHLFLTSALGQKYISDVRGGISWLLSSPGRSRAE